MRMVLALVCMLLVCSSGYVKAEEKREQLLEEALVQAMAPRVNTALIGYYGHSVRLSPIRLIDIRRSGTDAARLTIRLHTRALDEQHLEGGEPLLLTFTSSSPGGFSLQQIDAVGEEGALRPPRISTAAAFDPRTRESSAGP